MVQEPDSTHVSEQTAQPHSEAHNEPVDESSSSHIVQEPDSTQTSEQTAEGIQETDYWANSEIGYQTVNYDAQNIVQETTNTMSTSVSIPTSSGIYETEVLYDQQDSILIHSEHSDGPIVAEIHHDGNGLEFEIEISEQIVETDNVIGHENIVEGEEIINEVEIIHEDDLLGENNTCDSQKDDEEEMMDSSDKTKKKRRKKRKKSVFAKPRRKKPKENNPKENENKGSVEMKKPTDISGQKEEVTLKKDIDDNNASYVSSNSAMDEHDTLPDILVPRQYRQKGKGKQATDKPIEASMDVKADKLYEFNDSEIDKNTHLVLPKKTGKKQEPATVRKVSSLRVLAFQKLMGKFKPTEKDIQKYLEENPCHTQVLSRSTLTESKFPHSTSETTTLSSMSTSYNISTLAHESCEAKQRQLPTTPAPVHLPSPGPDQTAPDKNALNDAEGKALDEPKGDVNGIRGYVYRYLPNQPSSSICHTQRGGISETGDHLREKDKELDHNQNIKTAVTMEGTMNTAYRGPDINVELKQPTASTITIGNIVPKPVEVNITTESQPNEKEFQASFSQFTQDLMVMRKNAEPPTIPSKGIQELDFQKFDRGLGPPNNPDNNMDNDPFKNLPSYSEALLTRQNVMGNNNAAKQHPTSLPSNQLSQGAPNSLNSHANQIELSVPNQNSSMISNSSPSSALSPRGMPSPMMHNQSPQFLPPKIIRPPRFQPAINAGSPPTQQTPFPFHPEFLNQRFPQLAPQQLPSPSTNKDVRLNYFQTPRQHSQIRSQPLGPTSQMQHNRTGTSAQPPSRASLIIQPGNPFNRNMPIQHGLPQMSQQSAGISSQTSIFSSTQQMENRGPLVGSTPISPPGDSAQRSLLQEPGVISQTPITPAPIPPTQPQEVNAVPNTPPSLLRRQATINGQPSPQKHAGRDSAIEASYDIDVYDSLSDITQVSDSTSVVSEKSGKTLASKKLDKKKSCRFICKECRKQFNHDWIIEAHIREEHKGKDVKESIVDNTDKWKAEREARKRMKRAAVDDSLIKTYSTKKKEVVLTDSFYVQSHEKKQTGPSPMNLVVSNRGIDTVGPSPPKVAKFSSDEPKKLLDTMYEDLTRKAIGSDSLKPYASTDKQSQSIRNLLHTMREKNMKLDDIYAIAQTIRQNKESTQKPCLQQNKAGNINPSGAHLQAHSVQSNVQQVLETVDLTQDTQPQTNLSSIATNSQIKRVTPNIPNIPGFTVSKGVHHRPFYHQQINVRPNTQRPPHERGAQSQSVRDLLTNNPRAPIHHSAGNQMSGSSASIPSSVNQTIIHTSMFQSTSKRYPTPQFVSAQSTALRMPPTYLSNSQPSIQTIRSQASRISHSLSSSINPTSLTVFTQSTGFRMPPRYTSVAHPTQPQLRQPQPPSTEQPAPSQQIQPTQPVPVPSAPMQQQRLDQIIQQTWTDQQPLTVPHPIPLEQVQHRLNQIIEITKPNTQGWDVREFQEKFAQFANSPVDRYQAILNVLQRRNKPKVSSIDEFKALVDVEIEKMSPDKTSNLPLYHEQIMRKLQQHGPECDNPLQCTLITHGHNSNRGRGRGRGLGGLGGQGRGAHLSGGPLGQGRGGLGDQGRGRLEGQGRGGHIHGGQGGQDRAGIGDQGRGSLEGQGRGGQISINKELPCSCNVCGKCFSHQYKEGAHICPGPGLNKIPAPAVRGQNVVSSGSSVNPTLSISNIEAPSGPVELHVQAKIPIPVVELANRIGSNTNSMAHTSDRNQTIFPNDQTGIAKVQTNALNDQSTSQHIGIASTKDAQSSLSMVNIPSQSFLAPPSGSSRAPISPLKLLASVALEQSREVFSQRTTRPKPSMNLTSSIRPIPAPGITDISASKSPGKLPANNDTNASQIGEMQNTPRKKNDESEEIEIIDTRPGVPSLNTNTTTETIPHERPIENNIKIDDDIEILVPNSKNVSESRKNSMTAVEIQGGHESEATVLKGDDNISFHSSEVLSVKSDTDSLCSNTSLESRKRGRPPGAKNKPKPMPSYGPDVAVCVHCSRINTESKTGMPHNCKLYQCGYCSSAFNTISLLTSHTSEVHPGKPAWCCPLCDKAFTTKGVLDRHLVVHRDTKPLQCRICSLTFTQSQNLDRHMLIHTGESQFNCANCDAKFPNKFNLIRHLQTHYPDREQHKCRFCENTFLSTQSRDKHEFTHFGFTSWKCGLCRKNFSNLKSLEAHIDIYHDGIGEAEGSYVDNVGVVTQTGPEVSFDSKTSADPGASNDSTKVIIVSKTDSAMSDHKDAETSDNTEQKSLEATQPTSNHDENHDKDVRTTLNPKQQNHVCQFCGHNSHALLHLEQHIKECNKIADFNIHKCHTCDKQFSNEDNFKQHIEIHPQMKPESCSQTFQSTSELDKHKIQKYDRPQYEPLTCHVCRQSQFQTPSELGLHIRSNHNLTELDCPQCGLHFEEKDTLSAHYTDVHVKYNTFSCPSLGCTKSYATSGFLKKHLRTVHPDYKESDNP